jgi:general secretion pathway protein A
MYESHYGFKQIPFTRSIEVKDLYEHQEFVELKHRIKYVIQNRLFAVISGPVGAGKTTVLRSIKAEFNHTRYTYIYISQSALTPRIFYSEILTQLGINAVYMKREAMVALNKAVMTMYNEDRIPVIIVDEAHLLKDAMLEEIRFMINFNMDSMSPLSLILVGQTELKEKLKLKSMEAISQRITVKFHLDGLTRPDTEDYILTHLKAAGVNNPLFTEEAINEVFQFTGGIPRKINNICEKCLLDGYIQEKKLIDDILVKRVIKNECE